jgi:aerobic carbon-monoxide dehydrogenase small subunit
MPVDCTVNGEERRIDRHPLTPLSTVLREDLHLTGAKVSCAEGFCGSCIVLVDDAPAASCLLPLAHVEGRSIRTVESLADADGLSPLQRAFKAHDAVQCGMCFPGVLMSLTALLERLPEATEADVKAQLVGNICRCTGYDRIVAATLDAARAGRDEVAG